MSNQQQNPRPGCCTGPRTEEGKENSSRNSTTHGLSCEKFFLIPGETEEQFRAHLQMWMDEYRNIESPLLQGLIEDVAQAHWLVKRANRRMFESESALANAEVNRETPELADEIFRRLQLIQRYKTRHETAYQRAFRAIESFRKSRLAEPLTAARLEGAHVANVFAQVKSYQRLIDHCGHTPEVAWEKMHHLLRLQTQKVADPEPDSVNPPNRVGT